MNAKVSIVIPFYNRIQLVLRCIESVIAQTYGNYEIILVNDGSTENIDQIISLANNSDNIKILYQVIFIVMIMLGRKLLIYYIYMNY